MELSLKNDNDIYEIGNKIRDRREALGLSQDELADRIGTDKNSVSRHENGTREMKIAVFCQYADALSTDPDSLLPERLLKKPERNYEKLLDVASGLSEEDLGLLIQMAVRMKGDR